MGPLFSMIILAIPALVAAILVVPPFWMLFRRTGHVPAWSLLMVVPPVNLVLLWWLAWKTWPSQPERTNVAERFD